MKIQVRIEIRKGGIYHIFDLEENKQVLHELQVCFLKAKSPSPALWRPSLEEYDFFIAYFRFLREICQITIFPTSQQIDLILQQNRLSVLELFFNKSYGLYGQESTLKLDPKVVDELGEVFTRLFVKTSPLKGELILLLANSRIP
jgi:hypothetical protein